MKFFFSAQSSFLQILHDVDMNLRAKNKITGSAYWISHSRFFYENKKSLPLFSDSSIKTLFEWEYTTAVKKAPQRNITDEEIQRLEGKFGDPYLWNAIIADRRLYYGEDCKLIQNYKPRFTHQKMINIIGSALGDIEKLFDEFKPDVVILPGLATFGDYLIYLAARAYNLPFLWMRSTKINNFISFSEDIRESPEHVYKKYNLNIKSESEYPKKTEAGDYLLAAVESPQYEGSLDKSSGPGIVTNTVTLVFQFLSAIKHSIMRDSEIISNDNHLINRWVQFRYDLFKKPLRKYQSKKIMDTNSIRLNDLPNTDYIFFPLHAEPEIALSVFGRDYINQIETVRRLSQSIPLGYKIILKEHPRNTAYHTANFYRKLCEIPSVKFISSSVKSSHIIKRAKAVVVISGFVGFEAVLQGVPVIVTGDVNYKILPDYMVKKVDSPSELADALHWILKNFKRDEAHIRAFIAALMSESVPINLYSDLLKKSGRISFKNSNRENQIDLLSDHILKRVLEIKPKFASN